jgi:hypothetical protein
LLRSFFGFFPLVLDSLRRHSARIRCGLLDSFARRSVACH